MKIIQNLSVFSILSTLSLFCQTVIAQSVLTDNGGWHKIEYSGTYKDFVMPSSSAYPFIEFRVVGADGGSAKVDGCDRVVGGAGAIVTAILEIGTTENQIPPGSTLRFIVGQGGQEMNDNSGGGAGGGGGSAVLLKVSGQSDPYRILAVGGGGGGGWTSHGGFGICHHDPGNSAQTGSTGGTADGDDTDHKGKPGSNGQGAYQPTEYSDYGGGGGGAFSDAYYSNQKMLTSMSGRKGSWEGGRGGWQNNSSADAQTLNGGYGFGGGGGGYIASDATFTKSGGDSGAGGGGGYSGGANGSDACSPGSGGCGSAGGGGSYFHSGIYSGLVEIGDRTTTTHDGYIQYRFVNFKTIRFANDQTKCLDDKSGSTTSGTNIQLWDCNGGASQYWRFDGLNIRLTKALNKCIDLSSSNTNNGNNIQLHDCNDTDAQHWVYDGVYKFIRSKVNYNKCLDLSTGNTSNGANIQIWDCTPGNSNQQWSIEGATTKPEDTKVVTIRPDYAQSKCLDLTGGNTANGANIQLWDCGGTDSKDGNANQQWYFDGLQVKLYKNTSKCLDLSNSNTSNGANIQLYNCNNSNAQHWIYNGLTHELRSTVNLNKCIDVVNGGTGNGTNFQLYDCAGVGAQHFILSPVPCLDDITPPVAKCKDVTYDQLAAPTASEMDGGSYDNCAIQSMYLEKVNPNSNEHWKLTVTDPSGNSSSCTATLTLNY